MSIVLGIRGTTTKYNINWKSCNKEKYSRGETGQEIPIQVQHFGLKSEVSFMIATLDIIVILIFSTQNVNSPQYVLEITKSQETKKRSLRELLPP